jgi:signal transduction histidine kinase
VKNAADVATVIDIRARQTRGEVEVVVRDNGPGIASELRDRVFEPFVTDKEKGAGLGLAIVKRLADANGGRVVLTPYDPADGVGAEFRLYFSGVDDHREVDERGMQDEDD